MPKVSNPRQTEAVTVIKIDKDYINKSINEVLSEPLPSRVGSEWRAVPGLDYDYAVHAVAPDKVPFEKTRFRVLDDDGEVYYGGWLYNDEACINQQIVLAWAEHDAGATEIQVKRNDEWTTEIG
jgi:hypothetical protein